LAVGLGALSPPGYRNASGVVDLGHRLVPALRDHFDERTAEYLWWLGTLPLELFFLAIAAAVLFTRRGAPPALCLSGISALPWLFLPAPTLPAPDGIVWRSPAGIFTLGQPSERDLWFSGHAANAFVIALATRRARPAVQVLAWTGVAFES